VVEDMRPNLTSRENVRRPRTAVILAGGLGTRLSEETLIKPKPLLDIGPMPIIWHIMKHYSKYGCDNFVICLGYKGEMVKEFFQSLSIRSNDIEINLASGSTSFIDPEIEPWRVKLIDTGPNTATAGRLLRAKHHINEENFFFTYGDGLSDVNLAELSDFHHENNGLATVTAVRPEARYGTLGISSLDSRIVSFAEKPGESESYINGGFFVLNRKVLDFIEGDSDSFEHDTLPNIVQTSRFFAFRHEGFWKSMDTLRDANHLRAMWDKGETPWL
jgi:glucose-1-phosphate cytidylyltransferase